MLKSLRLQNVKSYVDSGEIQIAPISVFVGKNSCGKSSFIRFPGVLSQSIENLSESISLYSESGKSIDYGSFEDVVHNHNGDEFSISMAFECDISNPFILGMPYEIMDKDDFDERNKEAKLVSIRCTYKKYKEKIVFSKWALIDGTDQLCSFTLEGKENYVLEINRLFDIENDKTKKVEQKISIGNVSFQSFIPIFSFKDYEEKILFELLHSIFSCNTSEAKEIIKSIKDSSSIDICDLQYTDFITIIAQELRNRYDNQQIDQFLEIINSIKDFYCQLFLHLRDELKRDLSDVTYIGPIRQAPRRLIRKHETSNKSYVGMQGEIAIVMLVNDYLNNREIFDKVSSYAEDIIDCSIGVREIGHEYYELTVRKKGTNIDNNLMDVGYGVSQVLPIITQLAIIEYNSKQAQNSYNGIVPYCDTIIIEQPELHLHPAAQSKLAKLLAEMVIKAKGNRSILIETHSEHLIRALQLLVAEGKSGFSKDDLKFYYVEDLEGISKINEMKMSDYGQFLDKWPKGFFDEAYEISKLLMNAIAERKNR